jgi:hypothetical protein
LATDRGRAGRPVSADVTVTPGLVVEEPSSGFVGAVVGWEHGQVTVEDRHGATKAFPLGPGFWIDGRPVRLVAPARGPQRPTHTASGSRVGPTEAAKVALASRIYVEGRHDAELVEKVWGDDLRHVGVVVEFLGGIDDLPAIVAGFAPTAERRLGVLVDHLVTGTKESRIVAQVTGDHVLVVGHPFIDIWAAIKPAAAGLAAWPDIPKDRDWKQGISHALGRPANTQAEIATTWRWLLSRVTSWTDLDPALPQAVERLIDFVTA